MQGGCGRACLVRLAAFTLVAAVLLWGVLLSPPFTRLRALLGLPAELPGGRFNPATGTYMVEPSNPPLYFARLTHYYHVVFSCLLLATLVAALTPPMVETRGRCHSVAVALGFVGAVWVAAGGLLYAYYARLPWLHGLFIAGLGVLFASGIAALLSFRPVDPLDAGLLACIVLLLAGGVIGGFVGSSFIDHAVRVGLVKALELARINPDLAESNPYWRAVVGHEHAMVAVADTAALLLVIRALRPSRLTGREALLAAIADAGLVVMAVASYLVWPLGGIAHEAITPASIVLLVCLTAIVFRLRGRDIVSKAAAAAARLGAAAVWLAVVVPGAIAAASLRHPTPFLHPAFRAAYWDVAENAFNIGHWHILLAAWGVGVFTAAMTTQPRGGRLRDRAAAASILTVAAGFTVAAIGAALYMLASGPAPTPSSSPWMPLLELGLAVMGAGVAAAYLIVVYDAARCLRGLEGGHGGAS